VKHTFHFASRVVRLETGLRHHILPVPEEAAAAWKKAKVRRLAGTVNGHPVRRALQSHADGGSFIILGQPLLRDIGLTLRSTATVKLGADPRPDDLGLPDELLLVLEQDPEVLVRWNTFTPGRRRSLGTYISTARTEETRIKRSLELARKIRTHTLYGDLKKPSSSG
jgi:hypothetical protein